MNGFTPRVILLTLRKKLLPLLLILSSLFLLLTGCQQSSGVNPSNDPVATPSTEPEITYVTEPGAVTVYIYDLSYRGGALDYPYELEPGQLPPPQYAFPGSSNGHKAFPLTLSMPESQFAEAEITYEFTVSGGQFARPTGEEYGPLMYGPAYLGSQFTLGDNETIYWYKYSVDIENWEHQPEDLKDPEILANHKTPEITIFTEEKAYVDVIIRADGHIVGCVTITMFADVASSPYLEGLGYNRCDFYPKVLHSISYPMQDGQYQDVTVEKVRALMDLWKLEAQE